MTYLSRLTLKRSPSVEALQALLDPREEARRIDAHHRLIWTAFAGDLDRKRDFLWRDEGSGRFIVLSSDLPQSAELFEEPETQPFAPDLRAGDRLAFMLRANATRTVKTSRITPSGKRERQHLDVVMSLLAQVPRENRADERMRHAQRAGREWLEGAGARNGFSVKDLQVRAYRVVEPPGKGVRRPRFGVLDLEGVITLSDPAAFMLRLASGFGRAKAFGCGLMLIRRA